MRRLQRDILPNGAATPEEVEALLALDGALTRADKGWTENLSQLVASAADGLGEGAADWVLRATAAARPSVAAALTRRHAPARSLDAGCARPARSRASRRC